MTRRSPGPVLDLVAVVVLVGLALLGLNTVFSSWVYLVVALVAAAIGLAVVLATLRQSLVLVIVIAPVVGFVTGVLAALLAGSVGGAIPESKNLADLALGMWTGWGELLTTLPWVDTAGPPVLVPFVLGYAGAVLSGVLALRTRSAFAPLPPLLAVLVVVLLLRRPNGTGSDVLDWYPVAFAAVAIGWAVVRGLRTAPGTPVHGASYGRVGRGVAVVVVLASAFLVAMTFTASNTPGGATLRGRSNALPDLSGLDSPLRRFRTFTAQWKGSPGSVYDRILFTVANAPPGSRVRMVTLDAYDGNQWLPANDTMPDTDVDTFQRIDTSVDNPTRGKVVHARVDITNKYKSVWAPTIGSLTSLRLVFADPGGRRSALRYNLATSTAVLPLGLTRTDPYEFTSVVPTDRLSSQTSGWEKSGLSSVRLDPRLRRFLPKVQAAPVPPMKKVFLIAHWLRDEGRYSDGATPGEQQYQAGHSYDRLLGDFLLAPRPVGDDEQYASAMALMANRVGVPARVVLGAVLPRDGRVRGDDVHAWVEVRVRDGSWRTLPTREFMGHTPPGALLSPAAPAVLPPTTSQPDPPKKKPALSKKPKPKQHADQNEVHTLLRTLPWLLLLLIFAAPVLKAVRRWRRRRRGRPSDRMAGAWLELVDHARDLGIPVKVHASRPAQARVLARAGPLSREGDEGVFAADEPEEATVVAYWEQVMGERRALGQGQSRLRRVWAPFNPITLVRRSRAD